MGLCWHHRRVVEYNFSGVFWRGILRVPSPRVCSLLVFPVGRVNISALSVGIYFATYPGELYVAGGVCLGPLRKGTRVHLISNKAHSKQTYKVHSCFLGRIRHWQGSLWGTRGVQIPRCRSQCCPLPLVLWRSRCLSANHICCPDPGA
jgi:hypothetical protein